MSELLKGIRVVELGRIISAPYCAQLLADLGADVIKIEQPVVGDLGRTIGPPYHRDREGNPIPLESHWYLSANRNKRSVTANLAHPDGQSFVRELAAGADVFIENYRPGDMAKFNLEYERLRAVNPRLVYCSMSGFGQDGPRSREPGIDVSFQALSGMMSLTGDPDRPPVRVGMAIGDYVAAMFATVAIVSALYHRDLRGGSGQHVDLGLLDATLAASSHKAHEMFVTGEPPQRRGSASSPSVLAQAVQCRDGLVMISAGPDDKFRALCEAVGRADLMADPRFSTWQARIANKQLVVDLFDREIMPRKTVADWLDILKAHDIICAPIYDLKQAFDDPQARFRGMTVEVPHPLAGMMKMVANPLRFSATPVDRYEAPPGLGQHTDEVLSNLGYSAKRIDEMRKARAI